MIKKYAYLQDAYKKELKTKITKIENNQIFLEDTIFYPNGGGQLNDTGTIIKQNKEFEITNVIKSNGEIAHITTNTQGLNVGDEVICKINWENRYTYMKYHTASHILSSLIHKELGVKITGNQISLEKLRIDFDLENMDKELLKKYVDKTNEEIQKNHEVTVYYLKREDAMKIDGVVKLAGALPPNISELRIVKIGDVDLQADGGTHVSNTSEIGLLEFVKIENKGKNNRRLITKLN